MFVCLIFSTNRLFAVIQQSLKNCFHLFYKNWIKYTIHTLHSPSTDTKFIKHLHSIKIISLFAISRTQTHTHTQNKLRSNASITQQTETERRRLLPDTRASQLSWVENTFVELRFFFLSLEWWAADRRKMEVALPPPCFRKPNDWYYTPRKTMSNIEQCGFFYWSVLRADLKSTKVNFCR